MICAKSVIAAIIGVLSTTVAWAAAPSQRPPQPWPGPDGAYLFLEAESFQLQGKGWRVEKSPPGFEADKQSGLQFLDGSGSGTDKATSTLQISSNGRYLLWVRFSRQPIADARRRGPFRIVITQNGKSVFSHDFDAAFEGKPGDAPYYPNFVWASAQTALSTGAATITIEKSGPEEVRNDARQVDCLLLTTDRNYVPDYRDFAPQTYLRIKLIQSDPAKVYFYGFLDHMRAPWYHNIAMGAGGLHSNVMVNDDEYLSAGQSTPWINFSRMLYGDSDTNLTLTATARYHHPDASSSAFSVVFATAPDEKSIVATLERRGPGHGMQVRIPPDLTDGKKPASDLQFAVENLAMAQKLPVPSFGRVPVKFPMMIGMTSTTANTTPGTQAAELKVLNILGMNGLWNTLDQKAVEAGMIYGHTGAGDVVLRQGPGGYADPIVDAMEQTIAIQSKVHLDDPLKNHYIVASLTDEGHPGPLQTMVDNPACQTAFVNWLKEQKLTPADLGVNDWNQVKMTADRGTPAPKLYRASQQFRAWSIANFFKLATEMVRGHFPPKALSMQNFSDGAVYLANFYAQGNDYFTWFRNQALDLAWSEDWTNSGSTPQLCGWNVALLRAATRQHQQPIGMYDITSYHRPPLDVKLKAYSDIAQGTKILTFFSYSPQYQGHEPGFYMQVPTYAALMELTREVGAAEDVLTDAMPQPAQTVIIYSRDADIWDEGYDYILGMERMHTYLALRHAQDAVDVLDEVDVVSGQLKGRKVAYLFGEQLDPKCVEPLAQWVKSGGTLVLSPGAGGRDQWNQPGDALDRELGITRQPLQRLQTYLSASVYLSQVMRSQGKVRLRDGEVDYLAVRQDLSVRPGDLVPAKFDDGKPAYVVHATGQGRVIMSGFLPAISYIQHALVYSESHKNDPVPPSNSVHLALRATQLDAPTTVDRDDYSWAPPAAAFKANLRQLIDWPVDSAGVIQPVTTNTPLVEATFMEGKNGWVIPLANYTGTPLKKVAVTIRTDGRPFGSVRSSRQGEVQVESAGQGAIRLLLPLESTDMIYAPWRDNR